MVNELAMHQTVASVAALHNMSFERTAYGVSSPSRWALYEEAA
jgi:hypothetical protein